MPRALYIDSARQEHHSTDELSCLSVLTAADGNLREQEGNDDVNEDGFVEVESPATHAMFELSEEELLRQRNEFLESISVLSAFPGHVRVGAVQHRSLLLCVYRSMVLRDMTSVLFAGP